MNSLKAVDRSPEALAEAMLKFGLNSTLRREVGISARQYAIEHFSVDVVFRNNARIFRCAAVPVGLQ